MSEELRKSTVEEQAENALRIGTVFELECALRRAVIELPEQCAERVEAYAMSLELQRHIGLPDPVDALNKAAQKIREGTKNG